MHLFLLRRDVGFIYFYVVFVSLDEIFDFQLDKELDLEISFAVGAN